MLEVKVNKEIRDYTESMFFGLSMRQFVFSCLACGAAVGSYFIFKPIIGTEITSWICMLAAAPFAALGFIKYNGMPAETFIAAFIKSEILMPRVLVMRNGCYFSNIQDDKQKKRPVPNKAVKMIKRNVKPRKTRKSSKDAKEKNNKNDKRDKKDKKRKKGDKTND